MGLTDLVPLPYRILAVVGLGVVLLGFGYVKGLHDGKADLREAKIEAMKQGERIVVKRGEVTERIVTKYLPQVTKTQVVTETIVKEVPVYVPASAPDLPGGFRVLHDAAATGVVPDPARVPDAAAVPAQDVASTVAENYGACRETAVRLQGLQDWVRAQAAVRAQ